MHKPIQKCCGSPDIHMSGIRIVAGKQLQTDTCTNCGTEVEPYFPELGQAVFGAPYSALAFDDMPESHVVENMLRVLCYYAVGDSCYAGDFENDVFALRPYYWGDDDGEAAKPNFLHKPSGLEIRFYKYLGRGMSVSRHVCPDCFLPIFAECMNSLAQAGEV
jgi:hypothetical protein